MGCKELDKTECACMHALGTFADLQRIKTPVTLLTYCIHLLSSKSAHYFPGEKYYFVILFRKEKYILFYRRRYSIFQGCYANSLEVNNLETHIKVSSQDFQKCKISIKNCLSRFPWHPVVGTLSFCVGLVPVGKNSKCFMAKKP